MLRAFGMANGIGKKGPLHLNFTRTLTSHTHTRAHTHAHAGAFGAAPHEVSAALVRRWYPFYERKNVTVTYDG